MPLSLTGSIRCDEILIFLAVDFLPRGVLLTELYRLFRSLLELRLRLALDFFPDRLDADFIDDFLDLGVFLELLRPFFEELLIWEVLLF